MDSMTDSNNEVGLQADLTPTEKMLPVSRVNELIKKEKASAAEAARREMQEQMAQMQMQAPVSPPGAVPGGNAGMDPDMLYKQITDRMQADQARVEQERRQQEQERNAQEIAQQYFLKVGKGKEMFDDFEEVMQDFEPAAFPHIAYLATTVENTPAVMYELIKNPHKLQMIDALAQRAPQLAQKELKALSQSILKNDEAASEMVIPPPPLSRLKSSRAGTDTGDMSNWSAADFRKSNVDWMRG